MEDAGAERQPLLGEAHSKTQYETIEQVKYQEEHFNMIQSPLSLTRWPSFLTQLTGQGPHLIPGRGRKVTQKTQRLPRP